MPSIKRVVVNYGAPRSGTTWMEQVLKQLSGVFTWKLAEGRILHPCQSADGLVELAKMMKKKRLLIIRTVRDPMDVVESWVALRTLGKDGAIRKFTDKRCVEFLKLESERTHDQQRVLKKPKWVHEPLTFLQVYYDGFQDPAYRSQVAEKVRAALGGPKRMAWEMENALGTFNVKPVRPGRLAAGRATETFTTSEQRVWFKDQLNSVIEREGF